MEHDQVAFPTKKTFTVEATICDKGLGEAIRFLFRPSSFFVLPETHGLSLFNNHIIRGSLLGKGVYIQPNKLI